MNSDFRQKSHTDNPGVCSSAPRPSVCSSKRLELQKTLIQDLEIRDSLTSGHKLIAPATHYTLLIR